MHITAYFALLVAMLVCLGGALAAVIGLWRREYGRLLLMERGQWVVTLAVVVASAVLIVALWRRDFSFVYVAEYTDRLLPLFYAVTAFWAGQAGSLLFWMLALALFGAGFACSPAYRKCSVVTKHAYWLFFLTTEAFFLLLLTGPSNPFLEIVPPLPEGRGLNPLLRNPGMIFHPPLLFLGYAGFAIPCCLALSVWLTGGERSFLPVAHNVAVLSWIFLTAGIILGGWWSYMELGWGGYWAWDPVENASLVPWLVATAFLHTSVVERRAGALVRTNAALAVVTFASCLLGTYLVRSGAVESLHAFGAGGVGGPLLVYMLYILVLLAAVLLAGAPAFIERSRALSGLGSTPGFLVILTWLMLALAGVVLMGTLWPLISTLWSAKPVGLGAGFYNRVCLPLFALATALVAFCPNMSFTGGIRERAGMAVSAGLFLLGGVLLYLLGIRRAVPLFAGAAAIAAMGTVCFLLLRQRQARSRKGALGAVLVHLGLALVTLGVAVSGPYQQSVEAVLAPGRSIRVGNFVLTYRDLEQKRSTAMAVVRAVIDVSRHGRPVGRLTPERRLYRGFDQPFAEVSTIFSLGNELYATLLAASGNKTASLKISVNPLVNWIWIGGAVMCLAGFLALRRREGPGEETA